jgi:hypothetical protein
MPDMAKILKDALACRFVGNLQKGIQKVDVDGISIFYSDHRIREPAGIPRKIGDLRPPPPYQYHLLESIQPESIQPEKSRESDVFKPSIIAKIFFENGKSSKPVVYDTVVVPDVVPPPPAWRPDSESNTLVDEKWNDNFEKVRQFRHEHGRCPKKREGALGRWCDTQRSARKGQGTHMISPAQIAKLDGIGFDWDPSMAADAIDEPKTPEAGPAETGQLKRKNSYEDQGQPSKKAAVEISLEEASEILMGFSQAK